MESLSRIMNDFLNKTKNSWNNLFSKSLNFKKLDTFHKIFLNFGTWGWTCSNARTFFFMKNLRIMAYWISNKADLGLFSKNFLSQVFGRIKMKCT